MLDPQRIRVRVVDVYPYRMIAPGRAEFLVLRRSASKVFAGQWRMVGGKIEPGETAWQTALRETLEELGASPVRFWALPSVNVFYDWRKDRANVTPAFAAELTSDPVLNDEHDAWLWLGAEDTVRRFRWSEQQRLVRLVDAILRSGGPAEELLIPVDR